MFSANRRFKETAFESEQDFESVVKHNSKILFGSNSVYLDLKNKVESRELGGVVPDGFLFDFNDKEDPQFYLVEVELERHDFMQHIFPQITKYFAFYRNSKSRSKLIERLFEFANNNPATRRSFEQFVAGTELYKSIKDIVENSQNILLIADGTLGEVPEIQETYTDTWGKYVKSLSLKEYSDANRRILILNPSFDELTEVETVVPPENIAHEGEIFNENYHLEDVNPPVSLTYEKIKAHMAELDSRIVFNPQRYYISIRKDRNFAFLKPRKNRLKMVIMMPFEAGRSIIRWHRIRKLSLPVQRWYHGQCFEVQIEGPEHLEDIYRILELAYREPSNIPLTAYPRLR